MHVVIVSKTHMSRMACVGGIDVDESRSVRLLQSDGWNQPADTDFAVGQVWQIDYSPKQPVIHPHVEDVLVKKRRFLNRWVDVREIVRQCGIAVWEGAPTQLFDGLVQVTQTGKGYISRRRALPAHSTGFWIASQNMAFQAESRTYEYPSGEFRLIPYVGFADPVDTIMVGTLMRVSLARWWRPDNTPDMEERCYLQLSGWYT